MVCENVFLLVLIEPRQDNGVPEADSVFQKQLLAFFDELIQLQSLVNMRFTLTKPCRQCGYIIAALLQQLFVASRLVEWMNIFTLKIFNVQNFHILLVVHLPDLNRYGHQAQLLRGFISAMTGGNLILPGILNWTHQQGSQHSLNAKDNLGILRCDVDWTWSATETRRSFSLPV